MTVREKECLFMIYGRYTRYNEVQGRAIGYGAILSKCTCKNCMKEKEQNKKVEERIHAKR